MYLSVFKIDYYEDLILWLCFLLKLRILPIQLSVSLHIPIFNFYIGGRMDKTNIFSSLPYLWSFSIFDLISLGKYLQFPFLLHPCQCPLPYLQICGCLCWQFCSISRFPSLNNFSQTCTKWLNLHPFWYLQYPLLLYLRLFNSYVHISAFL